MVFITHLGVFYSFTHTSDVAIGSSILFLMPDVFIINSVFDILNDNTLVGIGRAMSTDILILCIAVASISRSRLVAQRFCMFELLTMTPIDGAFAAMAGFNFVCASSPPKRTLTFCALLAAFAHASRFWIMQMGFFNISVATLIVSFLSRI